MTGREILALVNKTPETHMLSQKIHGGAPLPIGADTDGALRHAGHRAVPDAALAIRRKADMTIELADGTKLRRDFKLPEEDVECLDALGFKWETVVEGGTKWLIIHGYPIPGGYNHGTADLALRMPPSYPDDQIDMVYFRPALALDERQDDPPALRH